MNDNLLYFHDEPFIDIAVAVFLPKLFDAILELFGVLDFFQVRDVSEGVEDSLGDGVQ